MTTKVIMPQMGESIAEGTITKWFKKVGDSVERDEPLFEISTDKVDAEIPAPAAGILLEIFAQEGETVEVNTEVATIGAAGEKPATGAAGSATPAPIKAKEKSAPAATAPPAAPAATGASSRADAGKDELRRTRSSPVVRRMASEHDIDISQVTGTGISGRVTRKDMEAFIAGGGAAAAPSAAAPGGVAAPAAPAFGPSPVAFGSARDLREPMSVMRKKIAHHMVQAKQTAAHVHTVFDVELTRVGRLRDRHKAEFKQREGFNLTWLPFIQKATVDSLRRFPILNASMDGDDIVYHRDVNLGIAVALDWGLIVPVIAGADALSLVGLARSTFDLATRARNKQLKPQEVAGNTFSITNPGGFGGRFGTPIIPQPTVAILGVGCIEKRAVVREDAIAIRTMCTLVLGFDHRLVDGAVADQFMADLKRRLEEARFEGLD
ncbi:MAG: dihydrolipoamide acetyltransferase family protein [Acidobacteria bacterium]|nr:dihydrolipoamide acetyltransferase family protein [Acidobacteriota bacterium]